MTLAVVTFWLVALAGHAAIWISCWNRVQGTSMPMWIISLLSGICKAACSLIPLAVVISFQVADTLPPVALGFIWVYAVASSLVALVTIPRAVYRRRRRKYVTKLRTCTMTFRECQVGKAKSLANANARSRLLYALPWNQSFQIEENTKEIEIPRLDAELDGISIAHISDLHFTGQVAREFFDEAVDFVNDMNADLIAITGDLVDRRQYLTWIPITLGRLRARHGVYAVLGNHDCKQNLSSFRMLLSEVGLTHLGARTKQLRIRDRELFLAGNELPWIPPGPDMFLAPSREDTPHLRVLLAHTPDELTWARHHDFDLMLAGHTHGGQFCIPGFGPFVCPSRLPLEYATGTIYESPTVLHVSRGLSGEVPLRLNCRPEITKIVLRCPQPSRRQHENATSTTLSHSDRLPVAADPENAVLEDTLPLPAE